MNEIKPKSKYLEKKIRETEFEERHKLNNLIRLEDLISEGICLEEDYPRLMYSLVEDNRKDYEEMLKELNPKKYKEYVANRELEKRNEELGKKMAKEAEEAERKAWFKAGGKK